MISVRWLSTQLVQRLHQRLINDFGGFESGGVNEALLHSALARPQQLLAYGEPAPTLFQLSAAYGFGLVRNHGFADGNKRIGLVAIDVFLQLNGYELRATEEEAVTCIYQLASGELEEQQLSIWIKQKAVSIVYSSTASASF